MNKKQKLCFTLLLSAVLLIMAAGCGRNETSPSNEVELIVSSAASLTDSLNELKSIYEGKFKHVKLNFNFGGSGSLRQQIEQGAPADLYISADTKNMQMLVDKQMVDAAQQKTFLTNDLVLIASIQAKTAMAKIEDLLKPEFKKIAVGEPQTVPAGSYTKEALINGALWNKLQPKIVLAKDVRQVLTYVETGNVDAGFVYKTDALTSNKVKVAAIVDRHTYNSIEYALGIVKATKQNDEAERFYRFLFSKEAQDVFKKYGFSIPKGQG